MEGLLNSIIHSRCPPHQGSRADGRNVLIKVTIFNAESLHGDLLFCVGFGVIGWDDAITLTELNADVNTCLHDD